VPEENFWKKESIVKSVLLKRKMKDRQKSKSNAHCPDKTAATYSASMTKS